MSHATTKNPMAYEVTGAKTLSKGTGKKLALKAADQLSTPSIIWLLAKRHKVGLLTFGNVILVLNWAIPEWVSILKSLFY